MGVNSRGTSHQKHTVQTKLSDKKSYKPKGQKAKKKKTKSSKKNVVTATDLLKQTEDADDAPNQKETKVNRDQQVSIAPLILYFFAEKFTFF